MRPLEGIRVLDLTTAVSGPFGAMLLADLGAEVIKVESPDGDEARQIPPYFHHGDSAYYLSINRNKQAIGVDLKQERGRELFLDLVRRSDVVFENFRPGVLARLGLDHDSLAAVNPRIVTCSLTGFGPDGPFATDPSFDLVVQAVSGGMSVTGHPGQPPARAGLPIGDLTGGLFAAYGILAALVRRERTGEGERVELSLLGSQLAFLTYLASYWFVGGASLGPQGSGHRSSVPYNAYECADGRWLVIAAHIEKFYVNFVRAIGRPELASDERFATRALRAERREELDALFRERLKERSRDDWLTLLHDADVPVAPVNSIAEVFSDPRVLALEPVLRLTGGADEAGQRELDSVRNPVSFASSPDRLAGYPPRYGEHTRRVLEKVLGYSADEIDALLADGVVRTRRREH